MVETTKNGHINIWNDLEIGKWVYYDKPMFINRGRFLAWYLRASKVFWNFLEQGNTVQFYTEPTQLFFCRESMYSNRLILQYNHSAFYVPATLVVPTPIRTRLNKLDPSDFPVWDENLRHFSYRLRNQRDEYKENVIRPMLIELVDRPSRLRAGSTFTAMNRLATITMCRLAPKFFLDLDSDFFRRRYTKMKKIEKSSKIVCSQYGFFGFYFTPFKVYNKRGMYRIFGKKYIDR